MVRIGAITVVLALLGNASLARADELPKAERDKIEHLIKFVADMRDAVFVRNGQEYDAATAAKFIRGKWNANSREIRSAKEFIEKAASVSSTSGKPYLIRFKDGKEVPAGEYLADELKRFEGG